MGHSKTCENCMHWEQTGATDTGLLGECHRNSPSPELTDSPTDTRMRFVVWPSTTQSQWCGAFEQRPMAEEEVRKRMAMIEKLEAERKSKK